jgi:tetratricopeptide (TPR) repeat protein
MTLFLSGVFQDMPEQDNKKMENEPIRINRIEVSRANFARGANIGREDSPKKEEENIEKKPQFVVKLCDKIISLSIFAIFFGIPLFFVGLTFQGVAFEKQIYFFFWVLLALVAWASKSVITGEMKIRKTALDIPILAFWAIYLVSTIFSVDRWHSFIGFFGDPSRGLVSVTALIIFYYIAISNLNKKRVFLMFLGALVSSSLAVIWTTLAIFGIKIVPLTLASNIPLSFVGSIANLGIFAGALIPLLLTAIFKVNSKMDTAGWLKKSVSILILLVLATDLAFILAISSFISWIALLIGIVVFLIFILSKIIRPIDTWVWLPMVVFVIIMAFLIIPKVQIARVNLPVEVSMNSGFSWDVAKKSIKDNFFLGSGPATYGYDFSLNKGKDFNPNSLYTLKFYQGSGIFFDSLPTIGIIGSVALAVLILTFLGMNMFLLSREKEKNKIYSLGIMSASIIFIVSAIISNAEAAALIMGTAMAILTTAILISESTVKEEFIDFSLKASPKFALALAFIFLVISAGVAFLFVFVGRMFVADVYAGMSIRSKSITEEGSVNKLLKAIKLYPREGRYYTNLGQQYMVLANKEMLKGEEDRRVETVQTYLNNSIFTANRGKEIMKNDVMAVEALARIYENAGLYVADSINLADETYKRALELDPDNPNYYLELGRIKTSQASTRKDENEKKQMVSEAKDLFQKAIDKKSDFALGYYYLALAQEALGETDASIESMGKAVSYQNNNVDYIFSLGRLYQARGKNDDLAIAETLFKKILGVNDKEINTHFNLGLLYEKTGRKSDAISEYRRVLELLPDSENNKQTKVQLNKMISNIESGIENTPESLGLQPTAVDQSSQNQEGSQ